MSDGVDRTADFIFKLFDEYHIDHEKGILALVEITKKELENTDEKIWQINLRLIPQQFLLFLMKSFS